MGIIMIFYEENVGKISAALTGINNFLFDLE